MLFIFQVIKALEAEKVPYAIVGGYAVALHGAMRGTADIDIAIEWSQTNLKNAEAALNKLGLVSRLPIDAASIYNFREEYINNRNLIAWNFYDPVNPANEVDIIIAFDLKKAKIEKFATSHGIIKVLSLKDLIKMKKRSGRPQDLEDIKALEKTHE